jgi:hypothetical protein
MKYVCLEYLAKHKARTVRISSDADILYHFADCPQRPQNPQRPAPTACVVFYLGLCAHISTISVFLAWKCTQKYIKSGTNGPSGIAHTLASGTSNRKRHHVHGPHLNLRRASYADPHIPHTNLGALSLYAFDHSAGTSQSFRKFCLEIHVTWQIAHE